MNGVIQKTDHPKEVLKAVEHLEDQVIEAEYLAEHMANPAVGFLRAMKTIDGAFEDFHAPTITAMLQAVMFRILNERVTELQKIAENADEVDDEEDDEDLPETPSERPVKRVILQRQCIFHTGESEDCSDCKNQTFCDPFGRK